MVGTPWVLARPVRDATATGGIRSCALTFCALMTRPRLRRLAAGHVRSPEGRAAHAYATEHDAMQRTGRGTMCRKRAMRT